MEEGDNRGAGVGMGGHKAASDEVDTSKGEALDVGPRESDTDREGDIEAKGVIYHIARLIEDRGREVGGVGEGAVEAGEASR